MKIVFLSNYFSHHQKTFSDSISRLVEGKYTFVASEEMEDERVKQGWYIESLPDYVIEKYITEDNERVCKEKIREADVIIYGSASVNGITDVLKNRIVFRYSERINKRPISLIRRMARFPTYYLRYARYKNMYLLSAGAYAAADYAEYNCFSEKAYKWGYFPETKRYDIDRLLNEKNRNKRISILWVGRLIGLKHPEYALYVAERLKADGYSFELNIIGNGEMEAQIGEHIIQNGLSDCVHMLGSMTPEEVRGHMEKANIYLFTSDFNEGWGAVLNESMNSGCAVVASHAIGAVPYLMKNNENGLIYRNGDKQHLYDQVKRLMDSEELRNKLGKEAYKTISETWNAEIAAKRLLVLIDELKKNGQCDVFTDGPCSRAEIIKNNWFNG